MLLKRLIRLKNAAVNRIKMEMGSDSGIDVSTFNLDKPPVNLKSEETIKRHSIDSNLESKPVEKALYLLTVGEEVQKLSVIYSIPELFKEDPSGCLQKFIPKMQQSLPNASTEFHIATSQTVKSIMEKKIISTETFVKTFLHTILLGLEHRDPVVADAWLECLLDVIPYISYQILVKEVQPVAAQRAALEKPVPIRITSCKIIEALGKRYPGPDLKRELLPLILSLCQDVSPDVRATICPQLAAAVRPIGAEAARTMLLPVIVDLASDESPKVKEIAYTTIVDAIPYFSAETIKNVVLPLLKQLCNYAFKYDENVLVAVAATYGKMVMGIEGVIASAEKEVYLKSYITLAEKGSLPGKKSTTARTPSARATTPQEAKSTFSNEKLVLCRKHCAFNYPAMAKFAYSDGNRLLLDTLHKVLSSFVLDPFYIVRRTIAFAFHEVVNIYGKYGGLLKPEIINLLKDESEEVIEGFVPNLGYTLYALVKVGAFASEQQDTTISEIVRSLTKCENHLSNSRNWRLYCSYIAQLEVVWFLFPAEIVNNSFISLLFKRIFSCRIVPVRLACIRTILVNLRYLQKPVQRNEIRNRLLSELVSNSSFYERMLYLQSCDTILEVFSTAYFKEHFFIKTIQMAEDQVPNIRWGVARLMPKLQNMVKLPAEKRLSTMIETAMVALSADKDLETLAMLSKSKAIIDQKRPLTQQEQALDQRKYDEEKRLANLNPKIANNFPASIVKVLIPSVNGVPLEKLDMQYPSAPNPAKRAGPPGGRGRGGGSRNASVSNPNPGQVKFTDKDFLVDTGIKMSFSKLGEKEFKNGEKTGEMVETITSLDNETPKDNAAKENNNDNLNSNTLPDHSERKSLIKNKSTFKPCIPVRKKVGIVSEELTNRKYNSNLEKRHSLEVMDANKNITLEQVEEVSSRPPSAVPRRKRSQLPRPLSCVVLPVRNLEKNNPPSRLPVMRKS